MARSRSKASTFLHDATASLRALVGGGYLLPLAFIAALRVVTWLMQGAVSVTLLPRFDVEFATMGLAFAVLGLAIDVYLWVAVLKLAIEAFVDARDPVETERGKADVVSDGAAVRLGLLLLACAIPAYLALAWGQQVGVAVFAAIVALAYLPAAIELLLFDSLRSALHPGAWLHVVRGCGGDYWRGPLFVALLVLALCVGSVVLAAALPPPAMAVASRFGVYVALVAGALFLGAAGKDTRIAVPAGPTVTPEEGEALTAAARAANPAERAEALQGLSALVRRGASETVHDRLRQLLADTGDREALVKHDIHYISVLVQWGLYEKALSIFEETRTRNDTVPLEAADDCAFLAHKALELHRRGTAYRLAKVFDARFPRHPWAIEAKILVARLGVEQFGDVEQGIAALSEVLQANPDRDEDGSLRALLDAWRAIGGARS